MKTDLETGYTPSEDIVLQEAENILESYLDDESYTSEVEYTGLEPEELEREITEAVDDLELNDGQDWHSRALMASGAVAGSAGVFGIATGNPLGVAPLLIGGGHYVAGKMRENSGVKEIETKAFLQDAMNQNLEVEQKDGNYEISFEYARK